MVLLASSACSGSGHHPAGAPTTTTLPAGTVTTDDWAPPALTGPASVANFCTALTAIYRHMGELTHVVEPAVSARFLDDYVSYAPTVTMEAPADIKSSAETYLDAVATYLHQLRTAGLQISQLPAGALQALSAPQVKAAYNALSGYSTTNCHYTIGGTTGG